MKLREILEVKGSQVFAIRPDQTVQDAVAALMQHRVGALLVQDGDGNTAGIITERDVLRECLHRADQLRHIKVREAMTKDVIVGRPDDDIHYTMGVMTRHRIRHLPVVDRGRLAGMISIGDVVKACLDETVYENRYLKEYIQAR
jgi:CBS domain-containing protein